MVKTNSVMNQEESVDKVQQVTEFKDSTSPFSYCFIDRPAQVITNTKQIRTHEIKDILQRPILVTNETWTSSDARGYILRTLDFPYGILTQSTMYQEKISNFKYFRADLKIKIVINATPFQQGGLLIKYRPNYLGYTNGQMSFYENQFAQPQQSTNAMHEILNLNVSNSMELCFPYVNDVSHVEISKVHSRGIENTFFIDIIVFDPLDGPTSAEKAGYSVYAWFTNIDLSVPSIDPFQAPGKAEKIFIDTAHAQSGTGKEVPIPPDEPDGIIETIGEIVKIDAVVPDKSQTYFHCNLGKYLCFCGCDKKPTTQGLGDEAEASSSGVIEDVAKVVGTVMCDGIPVPSMVEKIPSALKEVGKLAASVLGFSKPNTVSSVQLMKTDPFHYMPNNDGVDTSVNLGISARNALPINAATSETSSDPLAIEALLTRFNAVSFGKITTDNKKGDLLFKIPVTPSYFNETMSGNSKEIKIVDLDGDENTANLYYIPTYKYIADQFTYWRGRMVYKIRAFKCNYQTARLTIAWVPNDSDPTDFANVINLGNIMWDLSTSSEIEVEIPFMQNKSFCRTLAYASEQVKGSQSGTTMVMHAPMDLTAQMKLLTTENVRDRYCNGTLMIYVLNPMISSSASKTIGLVVTARLEKPEFAFPANRVPFVPGRCTLTNVGGTLKIPFRTEATAKRPEIDGWTKFHKEYKDSLDDEVVSNEIPKRKKPVAQGLSPTGTQRSTPLHDIVLDGAKADICAGEIIRSMRQLLLRFGRYFLAATKAASTLNRFEIYPFQLWNNGMFGYDTREFMTTPTSYDYIASMFYFQSGSMRYKVLTRAASSVTLESPMAITDGSVIDWYDIPVCYRTDTGPLPLQMAFLYTQNGAVMTTTNGTIEVQVPYYGRTSKRRVYDSAGYFDEADPSYDSQDSSPIIALNIPAAKKDDPIDFTLYRAGGDDMNFYFFAGAPPVILTKDLNKY